MFTSQKFSIRVSILLVVVTFLNCNGVQKTTEGSGSGSIRSDSIANSIKAYGSIQIIADSIFHGGLIAHYFKSWCEYQKGENPLFAVDSFKRKYEKAFDLVKIPFDYTATFDTVYHNYLSYSPDNQVIIDLFSNQIELEKLVNGKFGGMYTLQVKPFLLVPARKEKYIMNIYGDTDQFHDGYWLSNDVVLLIGTTKSDTPGDFSRMYRLWIIDLEKKIFRVYDNNAIAKNYYVDFYVNNVKFRGAEIYLDDQ